MAVFRVDRTRDYTVMCNHHLKDSNLSLKAKGLLSMMLSLPDEWNYTTRGLAAICKEGVDAIGKTLKELELAGYIIRRQLRGKDGRISDTEYTIFEKPRKPSPPDTTLPDTENPYLDNPDTEAPDTDTPAILNEFISRIEVHERDQKRARYAIQHISIYFNYIGKFENEVTQLAEPTEQEIRQMREEIEEAKKEKSRAYHRNYSREYRARNLEKQREYDRMKAREYRARRKAQAAAQPTQ